MAKDASVDSTIACDRSVCDNQIRSENIVPTSDFSGILRRFREEYLDKLLECAKSSEHLKSPQLEPVYKTIENYVMTHNLHLCNEPGETTRQYRIFGPRIFFHANDLAGAIAEIIPYVRMNTVVREKEFEILVDAARIIFLYNIDPTFAKIISPCGQTAQIREPNRIPAEVELVDIYHRLYSPDHHNQWEMLYEYENELWQTFLATRSSVSQCNQQNQDSAIVKKNKSPKHYKGGLDSAHVDILTKWLATQSEYAIVGNFALTCLSKKQCATAGAIQIIVANIDRAIESIKSTLEKFIPKSKIESRTYDLQLPTDYRIKKYVIIAHINQDIYYIANLFNCADFELIPIVSIGGLRIGAQEVILRFLFIELWFARVVHGFSRMTDKEYISMINIIFSSIDTVHTTWCENRSINAQPTYIGRYINESISKKTDEMIPPYFPAQYKRENGSYRRLTTKQ